MTTKKELDNQIKGLEEEIKTKKHQDHRTEGIPEELQEIIKPPIGFKNGLPPKNNLGGLDPEDLQEYLEFRKGFLSEEDLNIAPQDWETYLYNLDNKKSEDDEFERNEKPINKQRDRYRLARITKKLREQDQFSIKKLQKKAEEEIDSLLVSKCLDEEGVFLKEFKKENNLLNGQGPKGIQEIAMLQIKEAK